MISFLTLLKQGLYYRSIWPRRPELNGLFRENQLLQLFDWGVRLLPPLVLLTVYLQIQFGAQSLWPTVMASLLLILSLPLQGLYWLGTRAQTPLPSSLRRWYFELQERLTEQGKGRTPNSRPCYRDLAETLADAFLVLDRTFIIPHL